MNTKQYNMLLISLRENREARVGEYMFKITQRVGIIYEFVQIFRGKKTVLHAGTEQECLEAAREFILMTFAVGD